MIRLDEVKVRHGNLAPLATINSTFCMIALEVGARGDKRVGQEGQARRWEGRGCHVQVGGGIRARRWWRWCWP